MEGKRDTWPDLAEALAFCGNSLLSPMNQTGAVGFDPLFWESFPTFGDSGVTSAVKACATFAQHAQERAVEGADPALDASVEFATLFVGPPRPAAPPWESMYGPDGQRSDVGFGKAAIDMRRLIADAGLEQAGENNQYADHMGIELLFASVLCERIAAADSDEAGEIALRLDNFIGDHPLGWMDYLRQAVCESAPDGYIEKILALSSALLEAVSHVARIDGAAGTIEP